MIEGLAVWALFIYLLRMVGMPWNKATKSFAYLGGGFLADVCLGWIDQFHANGHFWRLGGAIATHTIAPRLQQRQR